jgi:hypothetical protein
MRDVRSSALPFEEVENAQRFWLYVKVIQANE